MKQGDIAPQCDREIAPKRDRDRIAEQIAPDRWINVGLEYRNYYAIGLVPSFDWIF